MNDPFDGSAAKVGAFAVLAGSACMLGGAALFAASGADLDVALVANDVAGYLAAARRHQTVLIANLSIWILGVMLLGAAASMMTFLSRDRQVLSLLARYNYWIAIPIVVASYMAWLAVVVRLAAHEPSSVSEIAEALGWFATHTDWVATVLVLGTGPVLLSLAGRDSWVPGWLAGWSYVTLFAGVLNVAAMYLGGLPTYGFIIIPVGMGWMIAAGVVLLRWQRGRGMTEVVPVVRDH